VRPKHEWNLLDPLVLSVQLEYGDATDLITDVAEVKAAMTTLMADLAAVRATPDQRADLEAALLRMRASRDDLASHREAAAQFTSALAAAAGNAVARCVVETIDVPHPAGTEGPEELADAARAHDSAEALYARATATAGSVAGGSGGLPAANFTQVRQRAVV
jgi:DNA-binding FadR family transcriptional regulator